VRYHAPFLGGRRGAPPQRVTLPQRGPQLPSGTCSPRTSRRCRAVDVCRACCWLPWWWRSQAPPAFWWGQPAPSAQCPGCRAWRRCCRRPARRWTTTYSWAATAVAQATRTRVRRVAPPATAATPSWCCATTAPQGEQRCCRFPATCGWRCRVTTASGASTAPTTTAPTCSCARCSRRWACRCTTTWRSISWGSPDWWRPWGASRSASRTPPATPTPGSTSSPPAATSSTASTHWPMPAVATTRNSRKTGSGTRTPPATSVARSASGSS
jgi:hypothetical protein